MATPQGFRPSLSPQQVKNFKRLYEQKPDQFNEQTVQAIQQHAEYYKLPFAESNKNFIDKTKSIMAQAGSGFFEGFTTFKTGEPPVGDAEAIARNLGHLAGFVGYIPGVRAARGMSVPMIAARKAEQGVKKIVNPIYGRAIEARAAAGKTATGFLQSNVVKDVASGAFHLGVASSVSSWQGGVDEMMDAFKHGAIAGGAFRGIGNLVQTGSPKADTALKTLAGSLFTGLPSTMRGETTPMQIYQYVLGAYFGKNELPVHQRMAQQHLIKMRKQKDPITGERGIKDPEFVEGWDKIDQPGKDIVIKQLKLEQDPVNRLAADILKNVKGISPQEAEVRAKELIEAEKKITTIKFGEEGEPLRNLTKEERREMELSGEDVDPQNIPDRISINAKSFVDNNMSEYLSSNTKGERLLIAGDLNNKWIQLIRKGKKNKINPADEMVDYINEKHPGFSSSLKQNRDFWVNIGFRRIKDSPVEMITFENGVPRAMKLDESGSAVNAAGNRKMLSQERKLIEEIYLEDLAKIQPGEVSSRGIYSILDHVVKNTSTGVKEYSLNKYKDYLIQSETSKMLSQGNARNIKEARLLGERFGAEQFDKEIGKLFSYMNDVQKQYYYGGRGDAERMYFTKYHPETPTTVAATRNTMRQLKNYLKSSGVNEKDLKEINTSRQEFVDKYSSGLKNKREAEKLFDRAYISNALYTVRLNGYEGGLKDISKIIKGSSEGRYIGNAKGFNKRSQIWFTSGYSSEPEVIIRTTEKTRGLGKADIENNELNIKIVEDLASEGQKLIGTKNSELFPTGDGAIYGRSDIIDGLNKQAGLPTEGGVNKSFIVSPNSQYGALLGKYMIHSVSPKMEKYMQQNNIHLIIPKSSAKQIGERKPGKFEWYRKAPRVVGESYKLPIKDIKVILSEKTGDKYLKPQRMLKQLYTNYTPFSFFDPKKAPFKTEAEYNEAMTKIFENMYQETSGKRIEGNPEINSKLAEYARDPIAKEGLVKELVENLDSIGVHEMLQALKKPGLEKFTNEVYSKIQKLNRDVVEQMRADGEYTDKQLEQIKNESLDFETVHERVVKLVDNSLAGFTHKFNRDYRMSVIRNFLVNSITRPEIGNSTVSRMRPYEIGMSKEGITRILEKRDDVFFLDDGFKKLMVDVTGLGQKGKKPLGELWEAYERSLAREKQGKGKRDKDLEELLRALVVRTPMDSMSGAHALKFKGFTGIRGFGSLLHGRTMEALGGADLDGDKAFIFFGGKSAEGKGSGFKKEWKDAFDWSKNEYVKNGMEESNKDAINPLSNKTYRQELTTQGKTKDDVANPALQFSPLTRNIASDAASQGRNQLGVAVTQSSYIKSAYSSVRSMPNGQMFVEVYSNILKKPLRIRIKAKTGEKNLRAFRGLTRASVGFASDPMDEAGLNFGKYGQGLLKKQTDALFEYMVVDKKGKPILRQKNLIEDSHKKTIINKIKDVNQAIYSKNYAENRTFNLWEIQNKLENLDNLKTGIPKEHRNTFLTKIGTDLKGLDWSDSILNRVNETKLIDIYKNHEKRLPALDALKDILGRSSMAVPRSKVVDAVFKHRLHTPEGMKEQLDPKNSKYNNNLLLTDIFKSYNKRRDFDNNNLEQRARYLNEIVRKAEDFIVNDFSDIASMKVISDLSENISAQRIRFLAKKADDLKKSSALLAKKSRKIDREDILLGPVEMAYLESARIKIAGEKQTASLDQAQIDFKIKKEKKTLNSQEAKLFDAFMLGTLFRGRKFDAQKLRDEAPSEAVREQVDAMIHDSKKTSLSRVGYNSDAIPDSSVKRMLSEYQELYDTSVVKVDSVKNLKEAEKIETDFEKVIEDPELTPAQRKRIDEYEPFIGLNEGKLSKAESELALRIKDHLAHFNSVNSVDLNGLMRWLVKKDLNVASLEDFKTLDRWFSMTRDGSWWQRIMRPAKDNKAPISRWHWLMFPKAIGKDTLRYDLKLMDQRGLFKNKEGEWIRSNIKTPSATIEKLQSGVYATQQQATQMFEQQKREWDRDLQPYLEGIPDGAKFFRLAVRKREVENIPNIIKQNENKSAYNIKSKEYYDKWAEIQKETNWKELQNQEFSVIGKDGKVSKKTGRQVVKEINKIIDKWTQRTYGWLAGKDKFGNTLWDTEYKPLRDRKGFEGDYLIVEKFLKKIDKALLEGKPISMAESIDGIREIAKSQMISYFPKAQEAVKKQILDGINIGTTGDLGKGYWPHLPGDPKLAAKGLKKVIQELANDPYMPKEERMKEIKQAIHSYKQLTGDFIPSADINDAYGAVSEAYKSIATRSGKKLENIKGFTENRQIGSQQKRDSHIPGWSVEPEIFPMYMKQGIDNYFKHVAQIKVRSDIYKFQQESLAKHKDPKYTFDWVDFYNLYAQDALGYHQNLPKSVLDNPRMKIKGTPYAWWNDTNVKNRINGIRKKMGIGKAKERGLPEELKGIDFGDLAKWGNLEAKYQLATLLAHPKSAVANLYGGSVHTLINTGYGNFKNARNIKYLQSNVNPEWNNMRDVEKWVQSLGVLEDFLLYEAGLNPKFQGERFSNFMKEAVKKIKRDPSLPDTSLRQIARANGIADSVFNKAAWFMRRPERTLRRDAFMAHYLHARQNFEGGIKKFDDPILIKFGMEGVKSTQFLYSAPFRPAFARSTMGKMMTRFQLWAWNSVRFRKEAMAEAKLRGYKEGTQEMERFKRMAAMDLMMFGLANVFMYSLFENTLPQPYGWMQDLADWSFGNEKERSRAFYGSYPTAVAPLQIITPPGFRALPPLFKWMIDDDSTSNASYIAWSMFPFGRMGYDIFGQGGLVDNPSRVVEKLTGLPNQQLARQVKKYKDEEMLYPRVI